MQSSEGSCQLSESKSFTVPIVSGDISHPSIPVPSPKAMTAASSTMADADSTLAFQAPMNVSSVTSAESMASKALPAPDDTMNSQTAEQPDGPMCSSTATNQSQTNPIPHSGGAAQPTVTYTPSASGVTMIRQVTSPGASPIQTSFHSPYPRRSPMTSSLQPATSSSATPAFSVTKPPQCTSPVNHHSSASQPQSADIQAMPTAAQAVALPPGLGVPRQFKTNLYVSSLPKNFRDEDLYALFGSFGSIESCTTVRDPLGQCKGYGFVKYFREADAAMAISHLNGSLRHGRILQVRLADARANPPPGVSASSKPLPMTPSAMQQTPAGPIMSMPTQHPVMAQHHSMIATAHHTPQSQPQPDAFQFYQAPSAPSFIPLQHPPSASHLAHPPQAAYPSQSVAPPHDWTATYSSQQQQSWMQPSSAPPAPATYYAPQPAQSLEPTGYSLIQMQAAHNAFAAQNQPFPTAPAAGHPSTTVYSQSPFAATAYSHSASPVFATHSADASYYAAHPYNVYAPQAPGQVPSSSAAATHHPTAQLAFPSFANPQQPHAHAPSQTLSHADGGHEVRYVFVRTKDSPHQPSLEGVLM